MRLTFDAADTEVLVVGGGAAACMAAISAHAAGAKTLVIDKGQLGKSGCSPNAHGGMAIYHKDPRDSWRTHAEDTLMSGGFLNRQELVRILVTEGQKLLDRLESFGCLFDRDEDGTPSVRPFGGHRFRRTVFSGDETGHEMMNGGGCACSIRAALSTTSCATSWRCSTASRSKKWRRGREESRGTHFREDFPERRDAEWLENIAFHKRDDGVLESEQRPVQQTIIPLADVCDYAAQTSPWH